MEKAADIVAVLNDASGPSAALSEAIDTLVDTCLPALPAAISTEAPKEASSAATDAGADSPNAMMARHMIGGLQRVMPYMTPKEATKVLDSLGAHWCGNPSLNWLLRGLALKVLPAAPEGLRASGASTSDVALVCEVAATSLLRIVLPKVANDISKSGDASSYSSLCPDIYHTSDYKLALDSLVQIATISATAVSAAIAKLSATTATSWSKVESSDNNSKISAVPLMLMLLSHLTAHAEGAPAVSSVCAEMMRHHVCVELQGRVEEVLFSDKKDNEQQQEEEPLDVLLAVLCTLFATSNNNNNNTSSKTAELVKMLKEALQTVTGGKATFPSIFQSALTAEFARAALPRALSTSAANIAKQLAAAAEETAATTPTTTTIPTALEKAKTTQLLQLKQWQELLCKDELRHLLPECFSDTNVSIITGTALSVVKALYALAETEAKNTDSKSITSASAPIECAGQVVRLLVLYARCVIKHAPAPDVTYHGATSGALELLQKMLPAAATTTTTTNTTTTDTAAVPPEGSVGDEERAQAVLLNHDHLSRAPLPLCGTLLLFIATMRGPTGAAVPGAFLNTKGEDENVLLRTLLHDSALDEGVVAAMTVVRAELQMVLRRTHFRRCPKREEEEKGKDFVSISRLFQYMDVLRCLHATIEVLLNGVSPEVPKNADGFIASSWEGKQPPHQSHRRNNNDRGEKRTRSNGGGEGTRAKKRRYR